jgi:type IV secretion system protein VirD4
LLTPDEVLRLSHGGDDPRDPGDVLIFISGEPPIKGKKSRYYYDAEFLRRAALPPPPELTRGERAGPARDVARVCARDARLAPLHTWCIR